MGTAPLALHEFRALLRLWPDLSQTHSQRLQTCSQSCHKVRKRGREGEEWREDLKEQRREGERER